MDKVPVWVLTVVLEVTFLCCAALGLLFWRARRGLRLLQRRLKAEARAEPVTPAETMSEELLDATLQTLPDMPLADADTASATLPVSDRWAAVFESQALQEKRIVGLQDSHQELQHLVRTRVEEAFEPLDTLLQNVQQELGTLHQTHTDVQAELMSLCHADAHATAEAGLDVSPPETARVEADATTDPEPPDTAEAEAERAAVQTELEALKQTLAQRDEALLQLQEEYDALSIEYQRIFENFQP